MTTRSELYQKFGLTAEAAQLFETDLGTMLLTAEAIINGWHKDLNQDEATKFYAALSRDTLGRTLGKLRTRVKIAEETEALFKSGLQARNKLNHGFFERHNFRIQTDEGRTLMVNDLEILHMRLFNAWQVAQRLAEALIQLIQTPKIH